MSENYIVSARKYRPQTFDTVVGQEHITTTLKNAIRNQHLAHAYLFCGPRGVGKTTCARILARTINCESPTAETEACGVCRTCRSFQDNTSFNIFELDAASNNSVDDIRNLTDQVRFAPQQGRYKIYIIDEVHMLSAAAFNAFLKTLEEPPPYAIFILATTEKHRILPTILSRCQIFDFKRITTGDITTHLQGIIQKEGQQADEAALHVIAQKSEGCMRDALSMLDRISGFTNGVLTYGNTMEHLNLLDADFYFRLTDHMLAQDVSATLLALDQVLEKGFEGDVILGGLAEHVRNLLLCKDKRMAKLLDVPNDHKPVYFEKANQAPPAFVLSALNVIHEAELAYKNAANKRLHVELCLIRLCYLLQAIQPGSTAPDEKKKTSELAAPSDRVAPPPVTATVQAPPSGPRVQEGPPQPAPVAQPAPAPAASLVPPPAKPTEVPPASPASGGGRRITKNLLEDLDDLSVAPDTHTEITELTPERAADLFARYRQEAQAQDKSILYAQLNMMSLELHPPDEVRIISPTEMTNEYALNNRNDMIDFFSRHTGMMVRVTTEVRQDATGQSEQKMVLSKPELYEALANKNPYLAALKDGLNLQIDY